MNHSDYEELIAAHVLGALDERERHTADPGLIDHVVSCESCRALLVGLREVGADLAFIADPMPVRQAVEDRLMEAVRGDPRATVEASSRRSGLLARVALVAALVSALVLGAISVSLYASRNHDRDVQQTAAAIINDPTATHLDLCARASAHCNLSILPDGNGVLIASHLPDLATGHVFELWVLQNGNAIPATVFGRAGHEQMLLFKVAPGPYDHAAITVERGPSGAQHPTSAMVFFGELRA